MYDHLLIKLMLAGTLLFLLLGFFLVYIIINHNNIIRQYLLSQQELIIKARELILQEVSEDMHDNVTQVMQLIRRNLYTAQLYSDTPRQAKLIGDIAELTDRVIRDIKHISHSLNGDFIKRKGLYTMLEYDSDVINATRHLSCAIEVQGEDYCLAPESLLLVYRIAQEAINNILQHAKAKTILIRLIYGNKHFKMEISDDGVGFDEAAAMKKEMMGLRNMRQRAALLNGCLDILSEKHKGSAIVLTAPLKPFKLNDA